MRLLTVGDSFTYGDELAEVSTAWPFLLANKLGYEVTNLALPGSGNSRMVRNCIEQVNTYDLVIIAWSHFARTEIADEHGVYDIWPGNETRIHQDICPWRNELIEYYNRHHNDEYLYKQYLSNIILLQSFLKANNKQYLMLDAFGNAGYKRQYPSLVEQISTEYYIGWPNETMMEWTSKAKQGPRNHFLERGHEIVADKIYEYIGNLGWLS